MSPLCGRNGSLLSDCMTWNQQSESVECICIDSSQDSPGLPPQCCILTWSISILIYPATSDHFGLPSRCEMFQERSPLWFCCNILQRTSGFDTPKLAAKDAAYACLVLGVFIAAYRSVSAARESVSVNPSRSVPLLFPLNSKETKPHALAAVFHHLSNRSAKQHFQ